MIQTVHKMCSHLYALARSYGTCKTVEAVSKPQATSFLAMFVVAPLNLTVCFSVASSDENTPINLLEGLQHHFL